MDEAARSIDDDDVVALAVLDDHHRVVQGRLLEAVAARQRAEAAELRVLAELGEIAAKRQAIHGGELRLHLRSVAAEAALPLHVSDTTIQSRITRATHLVRDWPAWLAAFEEGRIGQGHLRALERAGEPIRDTVHVTAEARGVFEAEMLATAIEDACSPRRLEDTARVEADRLLAEPLTIRHQTARADRTVWVTDEPDGMSVLGIRIPSLHAHGIHDRLLQIAKHRPDCDDRTLPNVMADTAAEMLLTAPGTLTIPGSEHIQARVHITMPATNLVETGYDETADRVEPALLDGTTPIDADTARDLASHTPTWMRLFLNPVTGHPVATDAYTPTVAQRRWLQTRDQHCRMPGCTRPAWHCDLDHTRAHHAGGPTHDCNLAHLCRRHHTLKHHLEHTSHAWRVRQLADGILEWTTPLGHTYIDRPEPIGPRRRRRWLRPAEPPEPASTASAPPF